MAREICKLEHCQTTISENKNKMHLLALTIRSAFYTEEKRHKKDRHISPVHLIVLHLPVKGGHSTQPDSIHAVHRGTDWCVDVEVTYRFSLQPIRDKDIAASKGWTSWQGCEILYRAGH